MHMVKKLKGQGLKKSVYVTIAFKKETNKN